MKYNIFKNNLIFILIFSYFSIMMVNYFFNSQNYFIKPNEILKENKLKTSVNLNDLKNIISLQLASDETYRISLDRTCKVNKNMHDRHKVRWVKQYFLKEIFQMANSVNTKASYYINIFLHSILISLSLLFLNKTFSIDKKYNLLFMLYVTFVFQQYLGEYSYSIFEMFFLSLAIYASKNKKKFLFLLTCSFAVLNRESAFLILLTWLVFNTDIKRFIIISVIVAISFILVNFQIIDCLFKPNFFIPLKKQMGQINLQDFFNNGFFSNIKLIMVNFIFPFGIFFYYYFQSYYKNKILLLIIFLYLTTFIFATPLHHVAAKLLILPIIFCAIYFKDDKSNQIS